MIAAIAIETKRLESGSMYHFLSEIGRGCVELLGAFGTRGDEEPNGVLGGQVLAGRADERLLKQLEVVAVRDVGAQPVERVGAVGSVDGTGVNRGDNPLVHSHSGRDVAVVPIRDFAVLEGDLGDLLEVAVRIEQRAVHGLPDDLHDLLDEVASEAGLALDRVGRQIENVELLQLEQPEVGDRGRVLAELLQLDDVLVAVLRVLDRVVQLGGAGVVALGDSGHYHSLSISHVPLWYIVRHILN